MMGKTREFSLVVLVAVVAVSLCSCGTFGWGKGSKTAGVGDAGVDSRGMPERSGDREAELKAMAKEYIAKSSQGAGPEDARLVKHHPYFVREYVEYPGGGEGMRVRIRETESRMAPYVADVAVDKCRYATQLHKKKDKARGDSAFIRETGVETLSFELRSEGWVKTGSLFLVEKREENVGGQWTLVKETVQEVTASGTEQEEKGFFGRIMSIF